MVYETKAAARRRKLRDALIEAAEHTIATEGLRGLKARELASAAGCAVGAIYNVVSDLDELVFIVNARTLAVLEEALTAAGAVAAIEGGAAEATARLTQLALAYLDFAATHTPRWRAVFEHQPLIRGQMPDWYLADQMRLFSYVEEPLKVLQPGVGIAERALIARTLVSAVHGIVVLGLEEKLQRIPLPTLRAQTTLMAEAIARGLKET